MHILFPIGSLYPSQAGGPSNTIYWLAKALTQKNVTVTLVSTNADIPPSMCDHWRNDGFGNVRYCTSKIRLFPFRLIWHAIRQLPKADLVHLTALFTPLSIILAIPAIILGKKVVWSIRGELSGVALESKSMTKKIMLFCIKLLKKRVIFHVTSNEEFTLAKQVFGENQPIIQIDNLLELPNKISTPTENYLLYLGRIHSIKALENFIEAASLSPNFQNYNYRIKMVGNPDNDYGDFLKKKAAQFQMSDKIDFLGKLNGLEKEKVLAAARFLVLPSHSENFGNVVIEALAHGTPVIASTGTPWQILEKTKSGFWTSNEPAVFSKTLDVALNQSAETYQNYRENAFQLVKTEYDVFQNVGKWVEAYQKFIKI